MNEEEFYLSTPAYFKYRQEAHFEQFKNGWEQTRFVAYIVAKTVDSKKQIKKPADLLPFSWDAPIKSHLKTRSQMNDKEREEFDQFDRDADEILKKTNPELYARYMEAKLKKDGITINRT
jgi:hypothetical protein